MDRKKFMIIGLDIDGTAFTHDYPDLGDDIGAFPWLRKAQEMGARFIIFTMRDGQELRDAVEAVEDEGIKVYGRNVNPTQHEWTMSPKAYCHLYIDDNGLGMPLKVVDESGRPAVDWSVAGQMMLDAVTEWQLRHGDS